MITPMVSLVVRKVTTGIIAPHGAIDIFHAIDNKQIKTYAVINIGASVTTGVLWFVQKDLVFVLLMALSAIHFRHQTFYKVPLMWYNGNRVKTINLIATSSLLLASSLLRPPVTYAFIAMFHTPHQYYKNRHLIFKKNGHY